MIVDVDGQKLGEVLRSSRVVVVDFWAPWCVPCRQVEKVINELARDYPNVLFARVDASREQELVARFNILSVPTVIVFKDGEPVETLVGAFGRAKLEAIIKKLLGEQ